MLGRICRKFRLKGPREKLNLAWPLPAEPSSAQVGAKLRSTRWSPERCAIHELLPPLWSMSVAVWVDSTPFVRDRLSSAIAVDIVRFDGFPIQLIGSRQISRNCRYHCPQNARTPGESAGKLIMTTPNQLSLLSKMTVVLKNRFGAFQGVHYPVHITALLEIDLIRIGSACGLRDLSISYSNSGRVLFTPLHYPRAASRRWRRALSDNICMSGIKE
jgi:hypothetical protein